MKNSPTHSSITKFQFFIFHFPTFVLPILSLRPNIYIHVHYFQFSDLTTRDNLPSAREIRVNWNSVRCCYQSAPINKIKTCVHAFYLRAAKYSVSVDCLNHVMKNILPGLGSYICWIYLSNVCVCEI